MAQIPTFNGSNGVVTTGSVGYSGTYNVGSLGNITTSNSVYTHGQNQPAMSGNTYKVSTQQNCPDLPALVIASVDEHGMAVNLTLAPEPGISVSELTKLMMMCWAVNLNASSFNALAFVKKNHLERHFTYS